MQLHGIHHVTAVSARIVENLAFYTGTLGLRLVKKTVNQDDTTAYHLFYADGAGSPGSDLTFFDWPAAPERRGTNSVTLTGLRVDGEATLRWWQERLEEHGVRQQPITTLDGRLTLEFEDPEGQRLALVDDGGAGSMVSWERSPVPPERQIRGLGPVVMSVPQLGPSDTVLREVLGMQVLRRYDRPGGVSVQVYGMGDAEGPASELHVALEPYAERFRLGAGGVHHIAFRTTLADYPLWAERLVKLGMPTSGPVDRFYFRSLYFREPAGILFEIATDEPGFAADEAAESLGEKLALPPFLEGRRAEIEARLKPLG